ncbi:MAG: hypothetical protein AB8H80_15885 [Planctomycetota bacterium]
MHANAVSTALLSLALALGSTAGELHAQDMLGVTYSGALIAVDSQTGDERAIGPGLFGQNCLCSDEQGALWTVSRVTLGTPTYLLTSIQPGSLALQAQHVVPDLRGLADAGNGELFAAEFQLSGPSLLSRIDTATGARTVIGPMAANVEALAMHQGTLYGYSTDEGLGTIDTSDGSFAALSASPVLIGARWLATSPDDQLIGGAVGYYEFDTTTGFPLLYANGSSQLRGAAVSGLSLPYGTGCGGIELRCTGSLKAGSWLTTRSTGYPQTGALVGIGGAILIGTSRTAIQGVPLPFDLDPVLGTSGCTLLTSSEASELSFTTGSAPSLYRPIEVPLGVAGQTFYVQHAGFDFGGNYYWSNGVEVRIGS